MGICAKGAWSQRSDGDADHDDHEAGDFRREQRPQRPEQPRHGDLHQACEDRHAVHHREATRFQRKYRCRQIRSGEDRRAQVTGADTAAAELLQHGSDRHHQHRERQHVDDLLRREARFAAGEHRHEQKDRDEPDVLQPAQNHDAARRRVVHAVDDVGGASGRSVHLIFSFLVGFLRFDPRIHARAQHAHRQVAFSQHGVVKRADVEALAETFLGFPADVADRELSDLVAERLARPHHVAQHLDGGAAARETAFIHEIVDRPAARPVF